MKSETLPEPSETAATEEQEAEADAVAAPTSAAGSSPAIVAPGAEQVLAPATVPLGVPVGMPVDAPPKFAAGAPVFLSYSSRNRAEADQVLEKLESNGIACWMAPRDILPGREWSHAIIEAINACRVLLIVLSPASAASQQVRREVERAHAKNTALVALSIQPVAADAADATDAPGAGANSQANAREAGPLGPYLSEAYWLSVEEAGGEEMEDLASLVRILIAQAEDADGAPAAQAALGVEGSNWLPPLSGYDNLTEFEASVDSDIEVAPSFAAIAQRDAEAREWRPGWSWGAFLEHARWSRARGVPFVGALLSSLVLYAALATNWAWSWKSPWAWGALALAFVPRIIAGARAQQAAWHARPPLERTALDRTQWQERERSWARRGLFFWGALGLALWFSGHTPGAQRARTQARAAFESRVVRPLRESFSGRDLMRKAPGKGTGKAPSKSTGKTAGKTSGKAAKKAPGKREAARSSKER
jgi:hypothetical protein